MTNLAHDTSNWHVTAQRISDPAELKALGAKSFVIIAISLLLTVAGFAVALSGVSSSGWLLGLLGLVSMGIWAISAANSRAASKLTGDDLIEIIVADEGVIGQGGIAIAWNEISEIQYEWSKTVVTGNRITAISSAAVGAALDAANVDTTVKLFEIRLKDYREVKARAESKMQRFGLFGPMLGDPGYLRVGQAGRSPEAMRELLAALAAQAERHGVPMTRKTPV